MADNHPVKRGTFNESALYEGSSQHLDSESTTHPSRSGAFRVGLEVVLDIPGKVRFGIRTNAYCFGVVAVFAFLSLFSSRVIDLAKVIYSAPQSPTTPSPAPPASQSSNDSSAGAYAIQVKSCLDDLSAELETSALNNRKELKERKLRAYWIKTAVAGKGIRFRVLIEAFTTKAEAQRHKSELIQARVIAGDSLVTDFGVLH